MQTFIFLYTTLLDESEVQSCGSMSGGVSGFGDGGDIHQCLLLWLDNAACELLPSHMEALFSHSSQ